MPSPYAGIAPELWEQRTRDLIAAHPLDTGEIVDVVQTCWADIFESRLGGKFRIGHDIEPKPQIMGFLLHELIPLELQSRHAGEWRPEKAKDDKDLVYVPDPSLSVELKTSSHPSQIFGNRSYAQPQTGAGKSKDGYYLTVNFEKFGASGLPRLTLIRFGWLDHTDWIGQAAATGQQARVRPESDRAKLLRLYSNAA
ncbi:MAG: ScaI family restriction endonuclease [Sphingomonas phyllosphaerae]